MGAIRRLGEVALFVALALAIHLALFWRAEREGTAAGGIGGDASVSMKGADADMAAMIAAWDAAPDVAEAPDAMPEIDAPAPTEAIAPPATRPEAPQPPAAPPPEPSQPEPAAPARPETETPVAE
ncbi:MAG: hypothetical protein AAGF90_03895, partial [Pseudomonadota bacterium]